MVEIWWRILLGPEIKAQQNDEEKRMDETAVTIKLLPKPLQTTTVVINQIVEKPRILWEPIPTQDDLETYDAC